VEIGNQLVAGDSRLDQFNVAGEGDVADFIYDMDAETVIGQEQIPTPRIKTFRGGASAPPRISLTEFIKFTFLAVSIRMKKHLDFPCR
jgi:hypothetical protein